MGCGLTGWAVCVSVCGPRHLGGRGLCVVISLHLFLFAISKAYLEAAQRTAAQAEAPRATRRAPRRRAILSIINYVSMPTFAHQSTRRI